LTLTIFANPIPTYNYKL